MALITDCRVCGERISLRKMRAGQYVAFEVGTDVQHQHTKSKKKRGKSAEPNTIENIRETNDNASDEINKPIFGSTNNQNNFSNNTSPEFKKIETSVEEKSSIFSFLIPIIIIGLIAYWLLK